MKSLHRSLSWWLCSLIATLFILAGFLVAGISWRTWLNQFDAVLLARASVVIAAAEVEDDVVELDSMIEDFAGAADTASAFYYEIRSASGNVLLRSPNLKGAGLAFSMLPSKGQTTPSFGKLHLPDGRDGRAVLIPFELQDDDDGLYPGAHLVLADDITDLSRQLRTLVIILSATVLAAVLLTLPLIYSLLGRGLRPVKHLATRAGEIHADKLDIRFQTESMPDELKPVAERMNDLLARLEQAFERESLFKSHVAHELRTPLAELRLNTETALEWPEEATVERLQTMHATVEEMQHLVETLLILSRVQGRHVPVKKEHFDLHSTVLSVVEQVQSAAEARQIQFKITAGNTPGLIQSDPHLWNAILNNLIGNAVHYAPINSTVSIAISDNAFSVSNPAPDLQADDLDHLFDSFWRKDSSRSGYGHAGLGLSLVKAYTQLLDMQIRASLDAGYLTMSLQLPVMKKVTQPVP